MKTNLSIIGLILLFFISCTTTGPKVMYKTDTSTGDIIVPVEYMGGLNTLDKKTKGNLFITKSYTKFVSETGVVHFNLPTSSIKGVYIGEEVKLNVGKTLYRSLLLGPFALFLKDKSEVLSIEFAEPKKSSVVHPIFTIKVGTGPMVKKVIQTKSKYAIGDKHWETAVAADKISAYEDFLIQHPDSKYAEEARSRLNALKKENPEEHWEFATSANTISAYEDFIKLHPDSKHAEEARSRLKEVYAERDWKNAQTSDTISVYEEFLEKYPDSGFADEARSRLNALKKLKLEVGEKAFAVVKDIPDPHFSLFLSTQVSGTQGQLSHPGKVFRSATSSYFLYGQKKSFEWIFDIDKESLTRNYIYNLVMASLGNTNVTVEIIFKRGKHEEVLGQDIINVDSKYYQHYRENISGPEVVTQKGDQVVLRLTAVGDDFGITLGRGESSVSFLKSPTQPPEILNERKRALIWLAKQIKWDPDSDIFSGFIFQLDLAISCDANAKWGFGWALTESGKPYLLEWKDGVFISEEISIEKAKELDIKESSINFNLK